MTVLTAYPEPVGLAGRHRVPAPSLAAPSLAAPSLAAPSLAAPSLAAPSLATPSLATAPRVGQRIGAGRVALAIAGVLGHTASLLAVLVITGSVIGMINSTPSGDDVTSTLGHSTSSTP
jgi:hypothetical protein